MNASVGSPAAPVEIDSFLTPFEGGGFDDPAWIDAEFFAIISANWDIEPPVPPARPTGLPARSDPPSRAERPGSRQRLTGETVADERHRRERSPPYLE